MHALLRERDVHHYHVVTPRSPVVLVGEDDPALRRLIGIALRRDGFDVLESGDGGELACWVRRLVVAGTDHRCVDLVIADQMMPTVTGLEVLARLRLVDWSTPFILITGCPDPYTRGEALRLGATAVVDKPFDLRGLGATARSVALPAQLPQERRR